MIFILNLKIISLFIVDFLNFDFSIFLNVKHDHDMNNRKKQQDRLQQVLNLCKTNYTT